MEKTLMNEAGELLAALPARTHFPEAMPRYPNLWFEIDPRLPVRAEYHQSVLALAEILERYLGLSDSFGGDVANSQLRAAVTGAGEGADFQARVGPLQHFISLKRFELSHWHQLHARFYATPLYRWNGGVSPFSKTPDGRGYFLIAASVHYEVATEDPLHPYEDECPLCGISGEYHLPVDRSSQDYCVKIHDPLGVEFLLDGRIRGQQVYDTDRGRIRSLGDLETHFSCRRRVVEQLTDEPRKLALFSIAPDEEAL